MEYRKRGGLRRGRGGPSDGVIESVSGDEVVVKNDKGQGYLQADQFQRSNQTCINQRLSRGRESRQAGDVDRRWARTTRATQPWRNELVAFMPWEGYNYEDAIVISERLVARTCLPRST